MDTPSAVDVLAKASNTRSSLTNDGILNNAQFKRFFRFVVDESVMKNNCRVIDMVAPVMEIPRLHLGTRITKGKTENVAPSAGDYVTVSGSLITLSTVALIVPWEVSWEVIEDNVESEDFEDTLIQQISTQFANDLEELAIQGDTGSGTPFLALVHGWLKLMTLDTASPYHDVDCSSLNDRTLNKTVFSKVLKGLPTKYRRNRANLRFFCHPDNEQDYRLSLTGRDTNVGDSALTDNDNLKIFNVPIVPVAYMPAQRLLLTHYQNLIMGIWRTVRLKKDEDIMKGTNLYAIHVRVGFAVENGDAVAWTNDLVAG